MLPVLLSGLGLSLSLIAAIGAQNVFVLRQGLRREHVLPVVLFCAISDAILIGAGVAGIGLAAEKMPALLPVLRWGGVVFLGVYGLRAAHAAWRGNEHLDAAAAKAAPLRRTLLTLAAITVANRVVLALLGVPQAQLGLSLIQMLATMAIYPAVVFASQTLMGVRKPAPGDSGALGSRA